MALEGGDFDAVVAALANDLEPAAARLEPTLLTLRAAMIAAGCAGVLLSGSGSCLFGLVRSGAAEVASKLGSLGKVVCTRFRGPR